MTSSIDRQNRARGLTGRQGVIIPRQNEKDLMLRHEVIDAVRRGKFHVHSISNINEGLEILTGLRAGKRLRNGSFEEDTLHDLVDRKLAEFAAHWSELRD